MPGITYPIVPGHEVIAEIAALGADVAGWEVGTRIGVGWNSGACGYCDQCRHGNSFACEHIRDVTGVYRDGGYAEHVNRFRGHARLQRDDRCEVDERNLSAR